MKKINRGGSRVRGKCRVATSTERGLKSAFQRHRARRRRVEDRRKFRGIVDPTLHADRALANGGNHVLEGQRHKLYPGPSANAEALESSGSENAPVSDVLFANFPEPRVHIAPDFGEDDAREERRDLQAPARAARRNRRGNIQAGAQNQHIPCISPRHIATDGQPRRHISGQIFRAMNRDVSLTALQRRLELTGKETFAAFVLQRPVSLPVTRSHNFQQLRFDPQVLA